MQSLWVPLITVSDTICFHSVSVLTLLPLPWHFPPLRGNCGENETTHKALWFTLSSQVQADVRTLFNLQRCDSERSYRTMLRGFFFSQLGSKKKKKEWLLMRRTICLVRFDLSLNPHTYFFISSGKAIMSSNTTWPQCARECTRWHLNFALYSALFITGKANGRIFLRLMWRRIQNGSRRQNNT